MFKWLIPLVFMLSTSCALAQTEDPDLCLSERQYINKLEGWNNRQFTIVRWIDNLNKPIWKEVFGAELYRESFELAKSATVISHTNYLETDSPIGILMFKNADNCFFAQQPIPDLKDFLKQLNMYHSLNKRGI